jgi:hypothetical protein
VPHRLRFAIQLCTLRTTGRFLSAYDQVPLKAVNYLTPQQAGQTHDHKNQKVTVKVSHRVYLVSDLSC